MIDVRIRFFDRAEAQPRQTSEKKGSVRHLDIFKRRSDTASDISGGSLTKHPRASSKTNGFSTFTPGNGSLMSCKKRGRSVIWTYFRRMRFTMKGDTKLKAES